MSKVYLGARLRRIPELKVIRDSMAERGHEVVSSWIDADDSVVVNNDYSLPENIRKELAARNANDIARCDTLVAWVEPTVRGLLVEIGIAWALGKKIIMVGNPNEVTPTIELPGVIKVNDFFQVFDLL